MPFPSLFIDRLELMFGKPTSDAILASFCSPKALAIRINTLKTTKELVCKELDTQNISFESVPWYESALLLPNTTTTDITSLPLYKEGALYIQSLSSMIPPLVLNPQAGDTVLDMAAAPGSKTSQMAHLMNNEGSILANDLSSERLYKLRANMESQGITNVQTMNRPGQFLWRDFPNIFDKVLIDAPCSMEGRFDCNDPDTYEHWALKKNNELSSRQKGLLRSAVRCTKPGGLIVYSTCTLSPEENEEVIDWILQKEGNVISVIPMDLPHLELAPALPKWGKRQYNEQVKHTKRILPSATFEGFYIALLRKND
jgi:NOL1/NOP2/sun family putative RNA methylase